MHKMYAHTHENVKRHMRAQPYALPYIFTMIGSDDVRALMKAMSWNQTELGLAVGVKQSTVSRWLAGNVPDPAQQERIASLLADAKRAAAEAETAYPSNASSPPVYQRFPAGRIPIFGRAVGGMSGRFEMNGERIAETFCPPILEGVRDAYAVYVHGSSMEPRYEAGETVWIHPYLPVRPRDYVVVQLKSLRDGEPMSGLVKQFVSRNERELVLRQLNPGEGEDELMRFPERDVFSVHKIVFSGAS